MDEDEMIEQLSREDGIANLHEEQALKIHMEETNAIINERNQSKAIA